MGYVRYDSKYAYTAKGGKIPLWRLRRLRRSGIHSLKSVPKQPVNIARGITPESYATQEQTEETATQEEQTPEQQSNSIEYPGMTSFVNRYNVYADSGDSTKLIGTTWNLPTKKEVQQRRNPQYGQSIPVIKIPLNPLSVTELLDNYSIPRQKSPQETFDSVIKPKVDIPKITIIKNELEPANQPKIPIPETIDSIETYQQLLMSKAQNLNLTQDIQLRQRKQNQKILDAAFAGTSPPEKITEIFTPIPSNSILTELTSSRPSQTRHAKWFGYQMGIAGAQIWISGKQVVAYPLKTGWGMVNIWSYPTQIKDFSTELYKNVASGMPGKAVGDVAFQGIFAKGIGKASSVFEVKKPVKASRFDVLETLRVRPQGKLVIDREVVFNDVLVGKSKLKVKLSNLWKDQPTMKGKTLRFEGDIAVRQNIRHGGFTQTLGKATGKLTFEDKRGKKLKFKIEDINEIGKPEDIFSGSLYSRGILPSGNIIVGTTPQLAVKPYVDFTSKVIPEYSYTKIKKVDLYLPDMPSGKIYPFVKQSKPIIVPQRVGAEFILFGKRIYRTSAKQGVLVAEKQFSGGFTKRQRSERGGEPKQRGKKIVDLIYPIYEGSGIVQAQQLNVKYHKKAIALEQQYLPKPVFIQKTFPSQRVELETIPINDLWKELEKRTIIEKNIYREISLPTQRVGAFAFVGAETLLKNPSFSGIKSELFSRTKENSIAKEVMQPVVREDIITGQQQELKIITDVRIDKITRLDFSFKRPVKPKIDIPIVLDIPKPKFKIDEFDDLFEQKHKKKSFGRGFNYVPDIGALFERQKRKQKVGILSGLERRFLRG